MQTRLSPTKKHTSESSLGTIVDGYRRDFAGNSFFIMWAFSRPNTVDFTLKVELDGRDLSVKARTIELQYQRFSRMLKHTAKLS